METYDIIKKLGSGAYGKTYQVYEKSNKQVYCIKKVDLEHAGLTLDEANKEVILLQQLQHPNIIQIFDHFSDDKFLYIVMEFADGGDLQQKIKSQSSTPFEEDFIINIFAQLAFALFECKKKNIIHRDIKPQNIFLTKKGQVKLGDFGAGRLLDSINQMATTIIGSPCYMAPEVINKQPYSFQVDIWSFGCVIYHLIMRKPPFPDNNNNEKLSKKNYL
jgi:NIMA (never in mitosis gene a)-related kinase